METPNSHGSSPRANTPQTPRPRSAASAAGSDSPTNPPRGAGRGRGGKKKSAPRPGPKKANEMRRSAVEKNRQSRVQEAAKLEDPRQPDDVLVDPEVPDHFSEWEELAGSDKRQRLSGLQSEATVLSKLLGTLHRCTDETVRDQLTKECDDMTDLFLGHVDALMEMGLPIDELPPLAVPISKHGERKAYAGLDPEDKVNLVAHDKWLATVLAMRVQDAVDRGRLFASPQTQAVVNAGSALMQTHVNYWSWFQPGDPTAVMPAWLNANAFKLIQLGSAWCLLSATARGASRWLPRISAFFPTEVALDPILRTLRWSGIASACVGAGCFLYACSQMGLTTFRLTGIEREKSEIDVRSRFRSQVEILAPHLAATFEVRKTWLMFGVPILTWNSHRLVADVGLLGECLNRPPPPGPARLNLLARAVQSCQHINLPMSSSMGTNNVLMDTVQAADMILSWQECHVAGTGFRLPSGSTGQLPMDTASMILAWISRCATFALKQFYVLLQVLNGRFGSRSGLWLAWVCGPARLL